MIPKQVTGESVKLTNETIRTLNSCFVLHLSFLFVFEEFAFFLLLSSLQCVFNHATLHGYVIRGKSETKAIRDVCTQAIYCALLGCSNSWVCGWGPKHNTLWAKLFCDAVYYVFLGCSYSWVCVKAAMNSTSLLCCLLCSTILF